MLQSFSWPPQSTLSLLMQIIFKVFIEFALFCFVLFLSCVILAPQPGIEPAPSASEGEVLTTGPWRKSLPFLSDLAAHLYPTSPHPHVGQTLTHHAEDVGDVLHAELLVLRRPVLQERVHVQPQLLLLLLPEVLHVVLQVVHGDQATLGEPAALSLHPPHDACRQPVRKGGVSEALLPSFFLQPLAECLRLPVVVSGSR